MSPSPSSPRCCCPSWSAWPKARSRRDRPRPAAPGAAGAGHHQSGRARPRCCRPTISPQLITLYLHDAEGHGCWKSPRANKAGDLGTASRARRICWSVPPAIGALRHQRAGALTSSMLCRRENSERVGAAGDLRRPSGLQRVARRAAGRGAGRRRARRRGRGGRGPGGGGGGALGGGGAGSGRVGRAGGGGGPRAGHVVSRGIRRAAFGRRRCVGGRCSRKVCVCACVRRGWGGGWWRWSGLARGCCRASARP